MNYQTLETLRSLKIEAIRVSKYKLARSLDKPIHKLEKILLKDSASRIIKSRKK